MQQPFRFQGIAAFALEVSRAALSSARFGELEPNHRRSAAESPMNTRRVRESLHDLDSSNERMSVNGLFSRANESKRRTRWHAKPFTMSQTQATRSQTEKKSQEKRERGGEREGRDRPQLSSQTFTRSRWPHDIAPGSRTLSGC